MAGKIELDELDIKLLRACQENSGKPLAEILEPFLGPRSQRALYYRFENFEQYRLVRIDRAVERGRSLCFITDDGNKVLLGWEEIAPYRGGGSP